jgi:hypothetical protein
LESDASNQFRYTADVQRLFHKRVM